MKNTLFRRLTRKPRDWWLRKNKVARLRIIIIPVIFITGLAVSLVSIRTSEDWTSFWLNIGSGLIGSAITIVFIDLLIGSREKQEEAEKERVEYRERLISELRNPSPAIRFRALEEIRASGWLDDGSISNIDLSGVVMIGARLLKANLSKTRLHRANFRRAYLRLANFREAQLHEATFYQADLLNTYLDKADLSGANFQYADLTNASLAQANLEKANLEYTNLNHANLSASILLNANLKGAKHVSDDQLSDVHKLQGSIMPDGKRYNGQFRLEGDLAQARESGIDITNQDAMSDFYQVSPVVYRDGQRWADDYFQAAGMENRISQKSDLDRETFVNYPSAWATTYDVEHAIWILSIAENRRIDSFTGPLFTDPLMRLLEMDINGVILDFGLLDFMSSTGVRMLVGAMKVARRKDIKLGLCEVPKRIEDSLILSGVLRFFRVYATLEEAIDDLSKKDAKSFYAYMK